MSKASVAISGKIFSSIDQGLVLLVGISQADGQKDIEYLVNKITNMRLFPNDNGNFEISVNGGFVSGGGKKEKYPRWKCEWVSGVTKAVIL